jgi:hypothetical protein
MGRTWIPPTHNMRIRMMAVAHAGYKGHRAVEATLRCLQDYHFYWLTMATDVADFVRNCRHCCSYKGPVHYVRRFGQTQRGAERGDLLHVDFLYMGPSRQGYTYSLNAFMRSAFLYPSANADFCTAAAGLRQWIAFLQAVL